MFRFIWFVVSSFISVFVARSFEGAVASTQAVTYKAVDSISQRLLRKLAWTLIGISLFASGVVVSILDLSDGFTGELTTSLMMKLTLTLIGAGFLYAGLSSPRPKVLRPMAKRAAAPNYNAAQALRG